MKRTLDDYFSSSKKINKGDNVCKQREVVEEKCEELEKLCSTLSGVLVPTLKKSWFELIFEEFNKEYFKSLDGFLLNERKRNVIYPEKDNVWSWTCVSPDQVKVVILGQDPYHNPKQAHGLAFSVQKPCPPPPSLINIYKELQNDIKGFNRPNHGCLQGWADQGVLLLNTTLTVRAKQPMSHASAGWEQFTDAVIKKLSQTNKNLVFMLWGKHAQTKMSLIDRTKHNCLLSVHPSPLSASRGFLGCKHFSKCNDYLKSNNKEIIRWEHLP